MEGGRWIEWVKASRRGRDEQMGDWQGGGGDEDGKREAKRGWGGNKEGRLPDKTGTIVTDAISVK